MAMDAERPVLRIGELSRRVGVSAHVLRAWERRYGLLHPTRSPGGFRLYSAADEQRVRAMQSHLAWGLAAAEAAHAALAQDVTTETAQAAPRQRVEGAADGIAMAGAKLRLALDGLDEPAAQEALDGLLARFTIESVLREVVLPYLHELGDRWEQGGIDVAQEHFASNVLRARLASLGRGWGLGRGPCAILACPPGEQHDLALVAFGLVLNRRGWRIAYLGADTLLADLTQMAREVNPDAVVLAATSAERFDDVLSALAHLGRNAPLFLAGAGATAAQAHAAGARLLPGDAVTEAQRLADSLPD